MPHAWQRSLRMGFAAWCLHTRMQHTAVASRTLTCCGDALKLLSRLFAVAVLIWMPVCVCVVFCGHRQQALVQGRVLVRLWPRLCACVTSNTLCVAATDGQRSRR
jgi:hypothetical protein